MAGMRHNKSRLAPVLIVLGALCAALAVYVAGYFLTSKFFPSDGMRGHTRTFNGEWQWKIFSPAARLESVWMGQKVWTHYYSEPMPLGLA
jgi:hypothetical protein